MEECNALAFPVELVLSGGRKEESNAGWPAGPRRRQEGNATPFRERILHYSTTHGIAGVCVDTLVAQTAYRALVKIGLYSWCVWRLRAPQTGAQMEHIETNRFLNRRFDVTRRDVVTTARKDYTQCVWRSSGAVAERTDPYSSSAPRCQTRVVKCKQRGALAAWRRK
jgi:hypothetical protein